MWEAGQTFSLYAERLIPYITYLPNTTGCFYLPKNVYQRVLQEVVVDRILRGNIR